MAFFPGLHQPSGSDVLSAKTRSPAFEAFYRDHIRKLLRVRGGGRYLSKGNYNVTRLEYLLALFPDARFVIPVRDPVWHIASLMKQHALFCAGESRHPEALRHMRRVGHFEFGLDRRPINAGVDDAVAGIVAAWERGDEVEGWARHWDHVYRFVADRLDADPEFRAAALAVRYEDLCRDPQATLRAVLGHCRLEAAGGWIEERAAAIRFPSYYRADFGPDELEVIARHTAETAARFGYPDRASDRPPPS
jgi:hypothetical protein